MTERTSLSGPPHVTSGGSRERRGSHRRRRRTFRRFLPAVRHVRWLVLAIIAVVILAGIAAYPGRHTKHPGRHVQYPGRHTEHPGRQTPRSVLPWASGVYPTDAAPAGAAAFAAWRGRQLDVVDAWSARATWADIDDPVWLYQRWRGQPYIMAFGVAMLPEHVPGVSLQACAAGSYNAYWREFGKVISSYGLGASIIRLGWEFNGNWYVWQASNPTTWARCWQQIVTSARTTAPKLKWDWDVNRGVSRGLADPALAYPGNAYVSMIGVDSYDSWPPATTNVGWQTQLDGSQGLNYWLAFAKAHGKLLSVPEWGNVYSGTSAGGDDAPYVNDMRAFFSANAGEIAFECNFQSPASPTKGSYGAGTLVPKAAAAYKADF
jgi:hypothetical protein